MCVGYRNLFSNNHGTIEIGRTYVLPSRRANIIPKQLYIKASNVKNTCTLKSLYRKIKHKFKQKC